jgi:hypothetical protein
VPIALSGGKSAAESPKFRQARILVYGRAASPSLSPSKKYPGFRRFRETGMILEKDIRRGGSQDGLRMDQRAAFPDLPKLEWGTARRREGREGMGTKP